MNYNTSKQTSEQKKEIVKRIKCFVLDMDGTIYLGNKLFDFTPEFLNSTTVANKEFYFFTNNSSKNAPFYVQKLAKMGIEVQNDRMLVSNGVLIEYLQEHYAEKSVYIVGTPFLVEDFKTAGIPIDEQNADIVILGFDTTLTYEKLQKACDFIRAGKPVLAANPDFNCPVENGGFIPDCGSIAALIHASTGVMPEFFGKPSRHTLEYILHKTGYQANEIAIVGDRLYTDIAVADKTEVTSVLVLTGETQLSDLPGSEIQPDMICESLAELSKLMR